MFYQKSKDNRIVLVTIPGVHRLVWRRLRAFLPPTRARRTPSSSRVPRKARRRASDLQRRGYGCRCPWCGSKYGSSQRTTLGCTWPWNGNKVNIALSEKKDPFSEIKIFFYRTRKKTINNPIGLKFNFIVHQQMILKSLDKLKWMAR